MNRNIALDALKLSLAAMVVGLHTRFLADISPIAEYLTVNGIFRIAVPMFFIINGYFFFSYILKKNPYMWIKRIGILYGIWMLFYLPFWIKNPVQNPAVNMLEMLVDIVRGFYHLWYLIGMIGAALMLITLKNKSFRVQSTLAFTLLVCGILIQYFGIYHVLDNKFMDKLLNMNALHKNFAFFSFPFFFVGFILHKYRVKDLISMATSLYLSALGFLLLIIESYINYQNLPRDIGFDNLVSLIIVCPALFILFLKLNIENKDNQFSNYSSGIYFIHIYVLMMIEKYFLISETLLAFFVISISFVFSYFLIKLNNRFRFLL